MQLVGAPITSDSACCPSLAKCAPRLVIGFHGLKTSNRSLLCPYLDTTSTASELTLRPRRSAVRSWCSSCEGPRWVNCRCRASSAAQGTYSRRFGGPACSAPPAGAQHPYCVYPWWSTPDAHQSQPFMVTSVERWQHKSDSCSPSGRIEQGTGLGRHCSELHMDMMVTVWQSVRAHVPECLI